MFIQYCGPFEANKEIIKDGGITRIAISGKVGDTFFLNNVEIVLGKTAMYEVDEVSVNSLKFSENVDNTRIVNCYIG